MLITYEERIQHLSPHSPHVDLVVDMIQGKQPLPHLCLVPALHFLQSINTELSVVRMDTMRFHRTMVWTEVCPPATIKVQLLI